MMFVRAGAAARIPTHRRRDFTRTFGIAANAVRSNSADVPVCTLDEHAARV
jgi:hypothetical protein